MQVGLQQVQSLPFTSIHSKTTYLTTIATNLSFGHSVTMTTGEVSCKQMKIYSAKLVWSKFSTGAL